MFIGLQAGRLRPANELATAKLRGRNSSLAFTAAAFAVKPHRAKPNYTQIPLTETWACANLTVADAETVLPLN